MDSPVPRRLPQKDLIQGYLGTIQVKYRLTKKEAYEGVVCGWG